MYSFNYLDRISDLIDNKILLERLRYEDQYDIIDEYISQYTENHAIMIGDSMGINLLLKKERSRDDFYYTLYTDNAFAHANNIANLLDDYEDLTIILKTTIPGIKYQIIVDTRILVTLFNLSSNSDKLINPILVKSFNKKYNLLVLSPEIQLLDIYRTLYSPNLADYWELSINDELKLFKFLQNRINDNLFQGGSDVEVSIKDRLNIEVNIMKDFIQNNDKIILLGDHALTITTGSNDKRDTNAIQILSENDLDNDFNEISKIVKKLLKIDIPITKTTRNLHIMQDFRLKRTTIKLGDQKNQKDIVYIYNSAHYDLIPFNKVYDKDNNFINIGNPFVLLRFTLVDFWIIRWIMTIGSIDEKFAKYRLDSIIGRLLNLRKLINPSNAFAGKNNNDKLKIFQENDYIGFYDDENISQKMLIKDLTKKYFDYFPNDYKSKFDNYRIIQFQ